MTSPSSKPKVLVLMAACNGERWLQDQVHSIVNQRNVEVTLVVSLDKKSSDGTESMLRALDSERSNITLLPSEFEFGAAGPNFFHLIRGVNAMDYDYVSFADQDDEWMEFKLHEAILRMQAKGSSCYSSNVIAYWNNDKADSRLVNKSKPQKEIDYVFESAGPGCTFVLSSLVYLEAQKYVISNWEKMHSIWLHDWFLYAFCRSRGFDWEIDERPFMYYRQHSSNQVGVNVGVRAFADRIKFVLSGKAMRQSNLLVKTLGLEKNKYISKWHPNSARGFIWLALNAKKCRRDKLGVVLFSVCCILLAVLPTSLWSDR